MIYTIIYTIIVIIIIYIIIIHLSFPEKNIESYGSGALVQLYARGPEDYYLMPHTSRYWRYPWFFRRRYPYYPYYYPYYYHFPFLY